MLIEFVERVLMRPRRLRKAIQAVVHENNELLRMLEYAENEFPTNLTWAEGDRWYGWTYNSNAKRYYFDDIGNESLMGLWEDQFLNKAEAVEQDNPWDYEWHVDAKTGDAWRLVKKETGYFGGRWWEDDDFHIVPFLGDNR